MTKAAMKKSGVTEAKGGDSPAQLIDARIKELSGRVSAFCFRHATLLHGGFGH